MLTRYLNEGFSGGEKKRAEILQMAVLQPRFAVLDETDSGLDIDALRIVADGVNAQRNGELGTLVITHYQRLLNYIKPEFVHVLVNGRIVKDGGPELALELEEQGYEQIIRRVRRRALDRQSRRCSARGQRGSHYMTANPLVSTRVSVRLPRREQARLQGASAA